MTHDEQPVERSVVVDYDVSESDASESGSASDY